MATKKFLLIWNEPQSNIEIDGYKAEYSLAGADNWTEYNETFTSTSGFITGLNICEFYDFRVFATNAIGTGEKSNIATGIKGNLPFAPIELTGIPTDTRIDLSWIMPNNGGCPINKSLIEYKESGTETYDIEELNNSDTIYSITGLTPETPYDIRLQSVNAVGTGLYSATIFVTTTEVPTIPGQVNDLQVQYVEVLDAPTGVLLSLGGTSANLSWDNLDMTNKIPLSGYYIRYKDSSTTSWDVSSLFHTNSGTITGLVGTECYSYEFEVAGLNISGTIGNYSNTITGNFGQPSAPTNISVFNMGFEYSISFTSPSNPSATGYNLYIDENKINDTPFSINDETFENGGLSYGFGYYYFSSNPVGKILQLSSVNECGEGPLSTGVIVPEYMN